MSENDALLQHSLVIHSKKAVPLKGVMLKSVIRTTGRKSQLNNSERLQSEYFHNLKEMHKVKEH